LEERGCQDASLVDSAVRGDRHAFGELVLRHQRLVAGVAWRSGVPRAEIEDVVSEVFIKAYCNLHRFRPEHAFSTWLYRVALNHVIDLARRRAKERGRTEMPEQVGEGEPAADERAEAAERSALLRAALRDLAPRYRSVLFLVYIEGLRVEEAARLLALPSGTVKTRLMRGREALRRLLAERHPEHFGDRS
jgi:RNA polymerase sigma-70 factor (ECF subfamily)